MRKRLLILFISILPTTRDVISSILMINSKVVDTLHLMQVTFQFHLEKNLHLHRHKT